MSDIVDWQIKRLSDRLLEADYDKGHTRIINKKSY